MRKGHRELLDPKDTGDLDDTLVNREEYGEIREAESRERREEEPPARMEASSEMEREEYLRKERKEKAEHLMKPPATASPTTQDRVRKARANVTERFDDEEQTRQKEIEENIQRDK